MAITKLATNYKDDVVDISKNAHRKYLVTPTSDTNVYTFEEKTEYIQKGSEYKAEDINKTNETVNQLIDLVESNDDIITAIGNGSTPVPKATSAVTATMATTATNANTADTANYATTADFADAVESDFILINKQTLNFNNNVCTLVSSRVTANSLVDVYFTSETASVATSADITVDTIDGAVKLVAKNTPSSPIVATIRVKVI